MEVPFEALVKIIGEMTIELRMQKESTQPMVNKIAELEKEIVEIKNNFSHIENTE